MSNYGYMDLYEADAPVDFDCPLCGDSADERGCINGCDLSEHEANVLPESWIPEDAAMESHLWGEC